MAVHTLKQGLDLPIKGKPAQDIRRGNRVTRVALVGHDYPTMKPRMVVEVGDKVKRGQLLFDDRKAEGIQFTAPAAGKVVAIHRGDKRAFSSLVIELSEAELSNQESAIEHASFASFNKNLLHSKDGEKIRALLSESGQWTALRTRPFSRIPSIHEECHALFVTAIDTNPLAPAVEKVVEGQEGAFKDGLRVLKNLSKGPTYLCVGKDWKLDVRDVEGIQVETFVGPHPAGLPGTHIHILAPAGRKRKVFYINYQDVIAVGHLFRNGTLYTERVVSIAGPVVKDPHLVRTRLGASIPELTDKMLLDGVETRRISGSVLYGQKADDDVFGYLHRYDHQVSCVAEDRERVFMGWMLPGLNMFSTVRTFLSGLLPGKREFAFTTTTYGSHRAMVPIGMYERVMPLDIMPTFLLRSLLVHDLERAEQLGCLELHEEDLGLCSFVSPGKEDYGKSLRSILDDIWKEG